MNDPRIIKSKPKKRQQKTNAEVVKYIRKNFIVRYNKAMNSFSVHKKNGKSTYDEEGLYLLLQDAGHGISEAKLRKILRQKSEEFKVHEEFSPYAEYLENLPAWDGEDHITLYANYIKPKHFNDQKLGFYHNRWLRVFRKWIVASVACVLNNSANDVMLCFVQDTGGTGKTRYTTHLTPEQFSGYGCRVITKEDKNINVVEESCKRMFIVFDELSKLSKRYLDSFKSDLSRQTVIKRHSHQRHETTLDRCGSFIASANRLEFDRIDYGLLRRLAVIEIQDSHYIDFTDYLEKVSIEQLYAQALHILHNTKFDYVWRREEHDDFINFNMRYVTKAPLPELISKHFRPGVNGYSVHFSASEIISHLSDKGMTTEGMSAENVGRALNKMGYTGRQVKNKWGYYVEQVKNN